MRVREKNKKCSLCMSRFRPAMACVREGCATTCSRATATLREARTPRRPAGQFLLAKQTHNARSTWLPFLPGDGKLGGISLLGLHRCSTRCLQRGVPQEDTAPRLSSVSEPRAAAVATDAAATTEAVAAEAAAGVAAAERVILVFYLRMILAKTRTME